jgi:hypothetical protein
MGEDLAGSEAWVRIRDPRAQRLEGAEGTRGIYGSRPVPGVPGATLETRGRPGHGVERILTVPKRGAGRRSRPSERPEDTA